MNSELAKKFADVKLLVLDFDGVLTDGYLYVGNDGHELVRCDHKDGQGIMNLKMAGVSVIVISGQTSNYVAVRCDKMQIAYVHKVKDKLSTLVEVLHNTFPVIDLEDVAFVGDDSGDLELLSKVSLPIAVADAIDEVRAVAHYVTVNKGGYRAVREICDLILEAKKENPRP